MLPCLVAIVIKCRSVPRHTHGVMTVRGQVSSTEIFPRPLFAMIVSSA